MKSIFTFVIASAFSLFFAQTVFSQDCDILIMKDGKESSVIVSEIRVSEIAYKKCDFQNGPLYIVLKNEVFMIKYRNGQNEVIKQENAKTEQNQSSSSPELFKKNDRKIEIKSIEKLVFSEECVNFHNLNGEINTGIIYNFHKDNITYKNCDKSVKGKFVKWKNDLDFITNNEGVIIYIKN